MAATGLSPDAANPFASPTACCSQMPTSKYLSGNLSLKAVNPVPSGMAAVTAITFLFFSAISANASPKTLVYEVFFACEDFTILPL